MRLIDADALDFCFPMLDDFNGMMKQIGINMAKDRVMNAPTIEATPVVHGRWEPHPNANGFERCSVCHDCIIYDDWVEEPKWYYCPNCGARMDAGV